MTSSLHPGKRTNSSSPVDVGNLWRAAPAPVRTKLAIYEIGTELQELAGYRLRSQSPPFELREITCTELPGSMTTTAIAKRHRTNRRQAGP